MLISLMRRYLAPYKRPIALLVLLQAGSAIASLYLPSLNADIIDKGVTRGDTHVILSRGALMLLGTVAQIACSAVATYLGARVAMAFGRDVRKAIFHHVGELSAREVAGFGAPSLITRTTNDVSQVQLVALMGMTMLVMAPLMCFGGIVMALREDASLSKLLLVAVPLLAGSIGLVIARMMPRFREMQPQLDSVNRIVREQITGARVIRAFVRDRAEAGRFDRANGDLVTTALAIGKLQALMFPTVMLVFNLSSIAVVWFGAQRVASGSLQVGALMAFIAYLMQILVAVMLVTFISIMIPRAAACAERIAAVLDAVPAVQSPPAPVAPSTVDGRVELRGVEYRYPGAELPVLKDISFIAEPGQVTAIIGGTGAGKTTLLDLIARMADPTAGQVVVNGIDAKTQQLESLWSTIGMVPQRAYLFSGTVASNLKLGDPDASDAQLWDALALAQAKDFVEAMPEQLNAPIAQGGSNVSGGQRQRLALARALIRSPKLFLLDDPFSAVDANTEARLRTALRERTAGATVILVAQRVASLIDADQILVLDQGSIVGRGRHSELLETCPAYAEIVSSQRDTAVAA